MKTRLFLNLFVLLLRCAYSKDYVKIINCLGEDSDISFTPVDAILLTPEWETGDKHLVHNYDWTYKVTYIDTDEKEVTLDHTKWLQPMSNNTYKLFIPKYTLPVNTRTKVTIYSKRKPSVETGPETALEGGLKECFVALGSRRPSPIILGGLKRYVPASRDIVVNAENSINQNCGLNCTKHLYFHWNCTQKMTPVNFCTQSPISTAEKFRIPGRFVREDDEFTIMLELAAQNSAYPVHATQTAVVVRNPIVLNLSCKRNCRPVTYMSNNQMVTSIGATCIENCEGLNEKSYQWTVKSVKDPSFNFDYSKTRHGRRNPIFVIEKNALEPGKEYIAEVRVENSNGNEGFGAMELKYNRPIDVESCRTEPTKGQSLVTLFRFSCDQWPQHQENFYELFVVDNDNLREKLVVADFYPEILERQFKLPVSKGKKFVVKVSADSFPSNQLELHTEVTSPLKDKPMNVVTRVLSQMYNGNTSRDSITKKITSEVVGERGDAIQRLQAIVDEIGEHDLTHKSFASFVENLKYKVADDALRAPVQSFEEVVKVIQSVTQLQEYDQKPQSDALLAKIVTTTCKKMVTRALEILQHERLGETWPSRAEKFTRSTLQCLESNSNPNYDSIRGIELNVTTGAPASDEPILTENYPNYVDHDETYYRNLENLQESTYNLINGSMVAAKLTALATELGEGVVKIFGKASETAIFKDSGSELFKLPIFSKGITLIPSKDFQNDNHSYDILMTVWSKNILWWNPGAIRIATPVISCNFWHSTCKKRVDSFQKPAEIFFFFSQHVNQTLKMSKFSFVVPKGYASMSGDDLNYQIQVHRFALHKGEIVTIGFHNLIARNAFDVVLTLNKFPTMEDFETSTDVRLDSNYSLKLMNRYDYDILAYVGVLVNKSSVAERETVTYELSSVVKTCMQWIVAHTQWVPACKVGNRDNLTTIHCQCHHFSIFAGHVTNVDSQQQNVLKPEIELVLTSTRVIFIALVVTLAIFFLISLCLLFHRKKLVYYVADNNVKDRFAYLVVVSTGIGFHDGTSSNIIIQLTGEKNFSEPHILNYPDPKQRMLQQGTTNLFVVATGKHLGPLRKLELWFDCTGQNPAWYCEDIKVYDLQKRIMWYFDIKQLLTVMTKTVYIEAKPRRSSENQVTYRDDSRKSKRCCFLCRRLSWSGFKRTQRYHTWRVWLEEGNFTYMKRSTVLLSNVLMIYASVLYMIGVPELALRDGLDEGYEIGRYEILLAFGCAFPAFVIHMCIAWIFRYSRNQHMTYDDKQFLLSPSFALACWLIIISVIISSITLLLIFGFWVPMEKGLVWLTICMMAISVEILIYEVVFNLIQSCFWRCQLIDAIWMQFTSIWKNIEVQRKYLFEKFGQRLLRPYLRHLYQPLNPRQIQEKRRLLRNRYAVISEFEDLIMFGVYMILLYAVILSNKSSMVVFGHHELEELMHGTHTRSMDFYRISTIDQIYDYINETLIPTIQPVSWYGNYVVTEPGLMIDLSNKYIGVVRLRQHRIPGGLCEPVKSMSFLNMSCWPEYSDEYAEKKSFGYNWGQYTHVFLKDRLKRIWRYSSMEETATLFTLGRFATYSGGGYVAFLGRTLYNSYLNYNNILREWWINQKTRVVFVEFLTYSANYNTFNSIRLIVEQSATGFLATKLEVYTIRMLYVEDRLEVISLAIFCLFVIWVTILLFRRSMDAIKSFKSIYQNVWALIDTLIILLSVICIVIFVGRVAIVGSYLAQMEEAKHNEYISYFYLFYIEDFLMFIGAILVCFSTIRLWKFLKFAKMFRLLERTMAIAMVPIITFHVPILIFILGSAFTLVLLLGKEYPNMASWYQVSRILLTMTLMTADTQASRYLGERLATFYIIINIIAITVAKIMFISLIMVYYTKAQMLFSGEDETYSIKHYFQERMHSLSKCCKQKLTAGWDRIEVKVRPKADKFVFLNCASMRSQRIKFMMYFAHCVMRTNIRKISGFSRYETKVILLICKYFFDKKREGKYELFVKERVMGTVILVPGRNIEKVAAAANLLFQEQSDDFVQEERNPELEECVAAIRNSQTTLRRCELELKLHVLNLKVVEEQIDMLLREL